MDQQLKIKSYVPDTSSYAPRISNEQWDQHKSLLKHLHDVGYKRAAMLDILRDQGFNPSVGQLNAKMTAWGFKVYGTQSDSLEEDPGRLGLEHRVGVSDASMMDFDEHGPAASPASTKSASSITLCEPESQWYGVPTDRHLTLDEVIILQSIALAGSYWPAVKPSNFGFKPPADVSSTDETYCQSVLSVADFLYAIHCFEQAFDLYFYVLDHLVTCDVTRKASLVRGLFQCAISATTDAQCAYVLSIVRRAHSYCVEHVMVELTACFASLSKDLCNPGPDGNNSVSLPRNDWLSDMPLLMATDPTAKSVAYRKEWLQQQLSECDDRHATLKHLSTWCLDTLSFYGLDCRTIGRPVISDPDHAQLAAFEHDFQTLVSALVIDYLNSPGPSMKRANVECKEGNCLFRSALSPSTSLIVMAHLVFEPLRSQPPLFQTQGNTYLHSRAQYFARSQTTTALQELRSFASLDSATRCGAFVDTFMKHFNTTLGFRRFVSNLNYVWDRLTAAKRLAQTLQHNASGFLPHAGLPGARRSILKTMASPFGHDPSLTESRPSIASDSGSMGDFAHLSTEIGFTNPGTGTLTPSDAMSIETRSSWSFHRVTGFANGGLSARTSVSSRRRDHDEMEEYRHFIKDNNYSQETLPSYPGTPTQGHSMPAVKDA